MRVDLHLLEAVCLAHDIGHPPFGHAGERVLNALMEPYGGFEGNAQTLRILTRTIYSNPERRGGMSPSRALLDGVLKYKRLHRDRGGETNHFIYDDQAEILEFCFGTADLSHVKGDVNAFRSLECQIMDLADDIAYSCFDIVDGVKARFLSARQAGRLARKARAISMTTQRKYLDELLDMIKKNKLQPLMNGVIGDLIQSASVQPEENFMTSRRTVTVTPIPLAARGPGPHLPAQGALPGPRLRLERAAADRVQGLVQILRQLVEMLFQNYLETKTKPPRPCARRGPSRRVLAWKTDRRNAPAFSATISPA